MSHRGFPGGSASKESACSVGDLGSIPGLRRSTGEGNGYPLQYSGLENSMDCIVREVTKSRTRLSNHHIPFPRVYRQWSEECRCSSDRSVGFQTWIVVSFGFFVCTCSPPEVLSRPTTLQQELKFPLPSKTLIAHSFFEILLKFNLMEYVNTGG